MRILRLNLLAFGPFTDVSLNFGASGAPLHIVFGPNEAGKSSCLRAMRAWLYGIPAKNNDDFIHQYANMRIGGQLENAQGEKLEFVRKKGNNKTLRTPSEDQVIEDGVLNRFLGGVDQATFEQRFAFDYEELKKGGEQISKGTGQLAEILFAAGAGITTLLEAQRSLDQQIHDLFKSRGTNASINAALQDWKESRDRMKELTLATADWERHYELLDVAQQRLSTISKQLNEARLAHNRCGRLVKALPISNKLSFAQQQLVDVEKAPILPPDFAECRGKAIDRYNDADQRLRESCAEISRLKEMLSEVTLPEPILQQQSAITGLHAELGSYLKAARDRTKLLDKLNSLKSQAEKLCERIGWEANLERAKEFRLPLAQRTRIDSLASDWTALSTRYEELQKAEVKHRKAAEKLESEATKECAESDLEGLRKVLRRALPLANAEEKLAELKRAMKSTECDIQAKLLRLPLYQGTIDRLVGLQVPLMETIERFQSDWKTCNDEIKKREERIEEFNQRTRNLDREIEKLQLELDVPTEEDLRSAREQREIGWKLLCRVISGEPTTPEENNAATEFVNAYPGKVGLVEAFAASVEHADMIADRLRREARRVSEKSNFTAQRREMHDKLLLEQTQLDRANEEKRVLTLQWQEAWKLADIQPLTPDEMSGWMQIRNELFELERERMRMQDDWNKLHAQNDEMIRDIQTNLSMLNNPSFKGKAALNASVTLREAIDCCEAVIRDLDAANQQIALRSQRLSKLREDLSETVDERERLEDTLDRWRKEWREAVAGLGLADDIRPEEARAVLREIEQLAITMDEIADIQGRIAGIDRDAKEFSTRVRLLLEATDQESGQSVEQAVNGLHQHLQQALSTQSKVQEWQEQLRAQNIHHKKAEADLAFWQSEIRTLCSLANCDSVDDLPEAEHRSRLRQQYEREVRDYRESLIELSGSEPLEDFLEHVRAVDADKLAAEFHQFEEEIERLEKEKAEAAKDVGARQTELNRMDGSARAAQAQEDMQHHLSTLRLGSEQYIRLRIADLLLRKSIERFREANQGPVLSRASQLFSELTLGSFSGLRTDFDEHDQTILMGIRADGVTAVPISGLSTGTTDQLYMALRLAMIESHARDHHPMPLILDDILIQFDDRRSAAALRVFDTLAEHTQIVYFTHHQRIVELAEQYLEPKRYTVHNLSLG